MNLKFVFHLTQKLPKGHVPVKMFTHSYHQVTVYAMNISTGNMAIFNVNLNVTGSVHLRYEDIIVLENKLPVVPRSM